MERFLTTYVLFEWFRSAYYTSHLDAVWAPSSVVLCRTRYRGPHFSLTARQPAAPRCSLGTAWTLADIPVEEVPRAYRSARSPLKNLWNSVEKKKKRKKKKKSYVIARCVAAQTPVQLNRCSVTNVWKLLSTETESFNSSPLDSIFSLWLLCRFWG